MKNYNYLAVFGLCLVLAQGSDVSAMPTALRSNWQQYWEKHGDGPLVGKLAEGFNIVEPADQELLYAAVDQNSILLLKFEENPSVWAKRYSSKVLRTAQDIAEITRNGRAYETLGRMLRSKYK